MRSNNNRMEVLREMEKNMTYESIRFNNKQVISISIYNFAVLNDARLYFIFFENQFIVDF